MNVACIEGVLQEWFWAYLDEQRRSSKWQKDLTAIMRLMEAYPLLESRIPAIILEKLR